MIKTLKSKLISVLAILALLTVSYIWVYIDQHKKPARAKADPTVTILTMSASSHQPTIDAVGTLQASQGAILKAQTSGQVEKIQFAAGDEVKQGDVLVILNNTQQQGALDAAAAQEQLNKLTYQRDLELKKLGAISLAAVDTAKAAVDAGAAAVDEAQGSYDLTVIKAPFAGRVGISKIDVGDYLQAADPIVSLQNLDPMLIDFYVPQKYFSAIKIGETVMVSANTEEKAIAGKIINYETVIDETTGMLQVRASVPNSQQLLLPGGYVTLHVNVGDVVNSINIPPTSIMYDEKGAYVYLVKDNVAHIQRVTLGSQIDQNIQILKGLQVGDVIVNAGTNKVRDNGVVQVAVASSKGIA